MNLREKRLGNPVVVEHDAECLLSVHILPAVNGFSVREQWNVPQADGSWVQEWRVYEPRPQDTLAINLMLDAMAS